MRETAAPATPTGTLVPAPYVVVGRREEASDVVTLALEPAEGTPPPFRHGQFNMITSFGQGEIAVSMSSAPGAPGPLEHSIRRVGAVSAALCDTAVGSVVGIRGPFGTSWGVDEVEDGTDVVVMAGGIGLAPLRGAVVDLVARQQAGRGRVFVLTGARSPDQILFHEDLLAWEREGAHVAVSVDVGAPGWTGVVGVVTELLPSAPFWAPGSLALLCGPEVMMRFTVSALAQAGVTGERVYVSMERNMQCGIGHCGHCQLGPTLVCRDGPVYPWSELERWLAIREL
jgi:anaerobic sulfite reductase subunit B